MGNVGRERPSEKDRRVGRKIEERQVGQIGREREREVESVEGKRARRRESRLAETKTEHGETYRENSLSALARERASRLRIHHRDS